jgi:hypothetical protein
MFWPAAVISPSMFTFSMPRRRNLRRPCSVFASANKGSTQTFQDTSCWITLADNEGTETTIFVNLNDEGDRKFVEQLGMVAGVLAVMMSEDDDKEDVGDEPA